MDTKFRKLISRLSHKEKDANTKANRSSGIMTVTSCTNNSQQLCEDAAASAVAALAEGESMNAMMKTNCSGAGAGSGCNSKDKRASAIAIVADSLGLLGGGNSKVSLSQDHYHQLQAVAAGGASDKCQIKKEPDGNNNNIYDTVAADEGDILGAHDKGFCLTKPITMLSIDTQSHLTGPRKQGGAAESGLYSEPASNTAGLLTTATATATKPPDYECMDAASLDVLTNVQFPCPTLIRKNKKRPNLNLNPSVTNGAHVVIYEELKPQLAAKPRLYVKKGASASVSTPAQSQAQMQAQTLLCNNNEVIGPETHQQKITHDNKGANGDNNAKMEQAVGDLHAHHEIVVVDVHAGAEKCDETSTLSTSTQSDDEEDNKSQSSSSSSSASSSSACPSSTSTNASSSASASAQDQQKQKHLLNGNNGSNKINGGGDGAHDSEDSIYVNLQELELARRQLIAAQVVKAKYAENWIDGQVVEDSIIGNKEKTKQYWEVRLRKEQDDKDKAAKKGSLSSNSVIQKMNAEIEELHRREKELKRMNNPKTSDDDEEEDIFSSTGSSVDEFEPSESPRLESGFYSNAGEDDANISSPELSKSKKATIEITLQQDESNNNEYNSTEELETPKSPTKATISTENNVAVEQDVTYPFQNLSGYSDLVTEFAWRLQNFIANYRKETPIEREIRLAREREQEYKQRRASIMSNDSQVQEQAVPVPTSPPAVATAPSPVATSTPAPYKPAAFISTRNVFEAREAASRDAQGKDLQYVLATERLKKEILEAKMREEELKARTQPKTTTLEENTFDDTNGSKSSSFSDIFKQEDVVDAPKLQVQEEPTPVHATPVAVYRQVEPTIVKQTSIEGAPASPQPQLQTVKSPITPGTPSTYQTFSFLARNPKFNTFERRYLLNMQLRIGTNFQIPKQEEVDEAAKAKEEEAVAKEAAAAAQEAEEPADDEPVAPRRRLVSTQQRIAAELREMREREKELELTRKFRSTSDLTVHSPNDDLVTSQQTQSDDDVFSESGSGSVGEEAPVTEPQPDFPITARSALGNKVSFGPPGLSRSMLANNISFGPPEAGKTRKKSNLVSQWEEKMQNGNEKA